MWERTYKVNMWLNTHIDFKDYDMNVNVLKFIELKFRQLHADKLEGFS